LISSPRSKQLADHHALVGDHREPHFTGAPLAREVQREDQELFMICGMILLVVATGVFASTVAGMLNDGRRLP
jgi:hypothetical protein